MNIKIQGDGYRLDGMLIPKEPSNRHYQLVQKWIAEGNTLESEFTDEELAAQRVSREQQWVDGELVMADNEIRKHSDAHGRTVGTQVAWRNYRNQLRDRVQGGVVSQGERPPRPTS